MRALRQERQEKRRKSHARSQPASPRSWCAQAPGVIPQRRVPLLAGPPSVIIYIIHSTTVQGTLLSFFLALLHTALIRRGGVRLGTAAPWNPGVSVVPVQVTDNEQRGKNRMEFRKLFPREANNGRSYVKEASSGKVQESVDCDRGVQLPHSLCRPGCAKHQEQAGIPSARPRSSPCLLWRRHAGHQLGAPEANTLRFSQQTRNDPLFNFPRFYLFPGPGTPAWLVRCVLLPRPSLPLRAPRHHHPIRPCSLFPNFLAHPSILFFSSIQCFHIILLYASFL